MSETVNQHIELDALRAQLDRLARVQEQLHTKLLHAREQAVQRESEIEDAIGELRATLAQGNRVEGLPQTDGQRVTNKYLAYQQLIGSVRQVAHNAIPRGAIVLVASRGDEDLLKLDERIAWHFPRAVDGTYAGHYPKDSAMAIEHLESLRAAGAGYLLFPQTAFWWLDYYAAFKQHLEQNYHLLAARDDTCRIYALSAPSPKSKPKFPRAARVRRKIVASKNGNGAHKQ